MQLHTRCASCLREFSVELTDQTWKSGHTVAYADCPHCQEATATTYRVALVAVAVKTERRALIPLHVCKSVSERA
jgi:hypothetical protein